FRMAFGSEHLIAEGMRVEVLVEGTDIALLPPKGVIGTAVQGGLDRCDDRLVRGWAINWNDPSQKLTVESFINDQLVGGARPDRPREDLKRLGLGEAACGFLFKFPRPNEMKLSEDVVVRALVTKTNVELGHSPWWVGRAVRIGGRPAEVKK